MASPIRRRTLLTGGAAAAAGLALPAAPAFAGGGSHHRSTDFTLDADVLDGGEQVTSVTLDTSRIGRIDASSLSDSTFSVHAKATSPIPLGATDAVGYDLDRTVTGTRLDRRGNIVLDLAYGEGQTGGGTLGYIGSKGRNVVLDLDYTITQNSPFTANRRRVTLTDLEQGRTCDPEVDAYAYRQSRSGLKYRLFEPRRGHHGHGGHHGHRDKAPLVVWLHGGGEGGLIPDGYYDNETTLRANRGALGFSTDEAQRIFGGAYVVAPQSTSFWLEDGDRFAPLIMEIIKDLVRRYPIDQRRIYVVGCSNGGYMSLKMTVEYPKVFAASVPICGVITNGQVSDAELKSIKTPTWLVAAKSDTTVPPVANTVHAGELIPGAKVSLYETVTRNGYEFPGHWSWIYVARNDPSINGQHIWQWMAQQRR